MLHCIHGRWMLWRAVQVSAYKSQHDKPPVMGVFVAVPLPDQRRCKRRQGRGTTATTVAPTRSVRLLTRRLSRKSRGKRTTANLGGCCVRQSRGTLRTNHGGGRGWF